MQIFYEFFSDPSSDNCSADLVVVGRTKDIRVPVAALLEPCRPVEAAKVRLYCTRRTTIAGEEIYVKCAVNEQSE